jgi:transcriptional regulator with XRE-family HTH domain
MLLATLEAHRAAHATAANMPHPVRRSVAAATESTPDPKAVKRSRRAADSEPTEAPAGDASAGVGARLRFLRDMHGLSQRELARRAGLTHATIGAIERDAISPSVGSLRKILDSLPMTLSEFFALDPAAETQVFFGKDELLEVGGGGISLRQVGHNLKGRPLQVLLERYAPGAETAKTPYSHSGDEGGVVIQGRIEITVGGSTRVLGPGDGYLFSSRLPHKFRNVGDDEAIVVSANTPPV